MKIITKTLNAETLLFWKNAGVNHKYLSTLFFNNLIAKSLGAIGIGLLIPIANGIIKNDFSLVTNSLFFIKTADFLPFLLNLKNIHIFILLSCLILILNITKSIISYKINSFQNKRNLQITSKATQILFKEQISLGKAFFDSTSAGIYANKMSKIPMYISKTLEKIDSTTGSIVEMLIYVSIAFSISPFLSLLTIPIIPTISIIFFFLSKKIKNNALFELEGDADLAKGFYNSVIKTPLIKIYDTEEKEMTDFNKLCINYEDKRFKIMKAIELIKPIQDILIFVSLFIVILFISFYSSLSAGVGVASLLVFFIIFRQLITSTNTILLPILLIPQKMSIIVKNFNRLQTHSTKIKSENQILFNELKESIICKNLRFGYKRKKKILKGLSCTIPKGKMTAIIGKSGSGKTTLINLILRLYNPPNKSIFFDNIDINEFTEKSVRNPFSYVSQDILIFDGSIKDNISYGLKSAPSEDELNQIIKEVGLLPFLERSKNGLNTEVGDRGSQLSGGERQRVALARALLNKSSIIIFDEPTSSVDTETEIEILSLIKKHSSKKTIIIITHSFLTIQYADHVIVIENGKTKEEGTIQELISNKNIFYRFWKLQTQQTNNNKNIIYNINHDIS